MLFFCGKARTLHAENTMCSGMYTEFVEGWCARVRIESQVYDCPFCGILGVRNCSVAFPLTASEEKIISRHANISMSYHAAASHPWHFCAMYGELYVGTPISVQTPQTGRTPFTASLTTKRNLYEKKSLRCLFLLAPFENKRKLFTIPIKIKTRKRGVVLLPQQ